MPRVPRPNETLTIKDTGKTWLEKRVWKNVFYDDLTRRHNVDATSGPQNTFSRHRENSKTVMLCQAEQEACSTRRHYVDATSRPQKALPFKTS